MWQLTGGIMRSTPNSHPMMVATSLIKLKDIICSGSGYCQGKGQCTHSCWNVWAASGAGGKRVRSASACVSLLANTPLAHTSGSPPPSNKHPVGRRWHSLDMTHHPSLHWRASTRASSSSFPATTMGPNTRRKVDNAMGLGTLHLLRGLDEYYIIKMCLVRICSYNISCLTGDDGVNWT